MSKPFPKLLTAANTKIKKGAKFGYLTLGIHLAPASLSGHNTCPMASEGCKAACLNTAGMGVYSSVQASRIAKTKRFFTEREQFMAQLISELNSAVRKAKKLKQKLAIRLNLTSDIQWELVKFQGKTVFEHFPRVQFYDYTKIIRRVLPGSEASKVKNYHLTFSRSESNDSHVELAAAAGANIAVVFAGKILPSHYLGLPVVSGDESDTRFRDPRGVIVGLTSKGRAKKDATGFVVSI